MAAFCQRQLYQCIAHTFATVHLPVNQGNMSAMVFTNIPKLFPLGPLPLVC